MRVLLDTCVLSELNRVQGSENVRRQVMQIADEDAFY